MGLCRVPGTRKRPLTILIDDLTIFDDQADSSQMQFIVEGDDVVERLVWFVLEPLTLAGYVGNLVRWKGRRLGVGPAIYQVSDIIGLIQHDGLREIFPMHHGGVVVRPVDAGAKPRHTLFDCHSLRDGEGPVHRIQLWVSIYSAVVAYVCPEKEASVGGKVPFLFLFVGAGTAWACPSGQVWLGHCSGWRGHYCRLGLWGGSEQS